MRRIGRSRTSAFAEPIATPGGSAGAPVPEVLERIIRAEIIGSLAVSNFDLEDDELSLIHWLDEIVEASRAIVGGRGSMREPDAKSLARDVSQAIGRLGEHVRAALRSDLDGFQRDVARLPESFKKATTARPVHGLAVRLRELLVSADTIRACWLDAIASVRAREVTAIAFHDLRALVVAYGQDWDEAQKVAQGVLHDDLPNVKRARGERVTADDSGDNAGLTWDERLALVGEWLATPVHMVDAEAYLPIAGADIPVGYLRVHDRVEFYSVETWRRVLAGTWEDAPDGWEAPPYLDDVTDHGQLFPPLVEYAEASPALPGSEVPRRDELARFTDAEGGLLRATSHRVPVSAVLHLSVPDVTFATARDRVTSTVDELLATAFPTSPWRASGVFFIGFGQGTWARGSVKDDDSRHSRIDVTRERLVHLRPETIDAITQPRRDSVTRIALDEQAALHRIKELDDPRQQVVLAARALEHHLPQPIGDARREPWAVAAERYMLDRWVWRALREHIQVVISEVTHFGLGPIPQDVRDVMDTFRTENGEIETIDYSVAAGCIGPLAAARTAGSIAHVDVLDLAARFNEPARMRSWLVDLSERAQRLYRGTSRARNSIIHGTYLPNEVAEHVAAFVMEEARHATMTFVNASLDGVDHALAFERARSNATRCLNRLRDGEHFGHVIATQ